VTDELMRQARGREWSGAALPVRQIGARAILVLSLPLFVAALSGCSSQNLAPPAGLATARYYPSTGANVPPHVEVASWYGPGFQGRPTSTGERFNENALTAASRTLPLGSRVRVTNPDTGRSVTVRINDRGPYVHGRSIDLSRHAARQIGLTRKGVAPVEVASATATPSFTAPMAVARPAAHAYEPRRASLVPHWPERAAATRRRSEYRSSRRSTHRYYHPRMVANPVGAWLAGIWRGF
jgi:rare lipoprotein A